MILTALLAAHGDISVSGVLDLCFAWEKTYYRLTHPGRYKTRTSATQSNASHCLPYFLGFRWIVGHKLHTDRTVLEYGAEFEHFVFYHKEGEQSGVQSRG